MCSASESAHVSTKLASVKTRLPWNISSWSKLSPSFSSCQARLTCWERSDVRGAFVTTSVRTTENREWLMRGGMVFWGYGGCRAWDCATMCVCAFMGLQVCALLCAGVLPFRNPFWCNINLSLPSLIGFPSKTFFMISTRQTYVVRFLKKKKSCMHRCFIEFEFLKQRDSFLTFYHICWI